MASQRKSPMDHPVVVTFLILAVIGAMSLAAEVLKPLALAVLLSFALAPLAGFFERRRVPRAIAVLLTVALALGSLSGIGYVVVRQLSSAGLRTAELSEGNPEEGGLPEAVGRHCVLSGAESRRRRGQVARHAGRRGARGDGRAGRRAAHVPAAPPGGRRALPGVRRRRYFRAHPGPVHAHEPGGPGRPDRPALRPAPDQPHDPDHERDRPADQPLPGDDHAGQLGVRADRRPGPLGDRRAVRGALGMPGGDDAVHPLRRGGGGVPSAAGLLDRALPRLEAAAGSGRTLRGGRGGARAIWSRSSTARPPGCRPLDSWSRRCSGRGSGGCSAPCCRRP